MNTWPPWPSLSDVPDRAVRVATVRISKAAYTIAHSASTEPRKVASAYGVILSFVFVRFAAWWSHNTVGFSVSIKGCYTAPLEQVCTCFWAWSPVANRFSLGPGYFSTLSFVFIHSFIHSFIHQWLYSTLLGPGPFFNFVIFFTQTVGWGMSPSQGRYLHTWQNKYRIKAHRYLCLEWDSNP
jgi:hypothetical protein